MTGGKPPQAGQPQQVNLVWKPATSEWMVKLNGGPEVKPAQAKSQLAKDAGPTMFIVDIQGATTATFKDPGGLAVWEGSKASPQSGINSTQILGPIVTNNGKRLIFFDLNYGGAANLNYELTFNSGPKVDPIIENGGGSWL